MKLQKKYQQPILEKYYLDVINSIESLEEEALNSNKNYFSNIFKRIKSILLYKIPIDIEIIDNKKSESSNEDKEVSIEGEKIEKNINFGT